MVLFLGVGSVILDLCLLYLGLNFLARPTYVWVFAPPLEEIVAWYITPF